MSILKPFKTVPELFKYITEDFEKGKTKPMLMRKVNEKYEGISYAQVRRETEKWALGLTKLGVKKTDKVAIISENRPEWVYVDMAVLGLGAVDVPLYPISTAETVQFILNDSKSVGVFVSNKFQLNKVLKIKNNCKEIGFVIVFSDEDVSDLDNVYTIKQIQSFGEEFGNENPDYFNSTMTYAREDDLCTLIYTSGTTGEPKGVMLTHKNILSNVRSAHQVFDMGPDDIFLSFLPLSHVFERMAGYYSALSCGASIAYAESIEKIAINLKEVRPTIMAAVPRLFERIYSKIRRKIDNEPEKKQKIFRWAIDTGIQYNSLKKSTESIPISLTLKRKLADKLVYGKLREATGGRLRFFISGGAALARELGEFFDAVGILIIEGYGLTESSPVIACNTPKDYKFGTVGKTFPGCELKIAKDGEILAAGPNIMLGYYNNKKGTDEVIKNGWLHTGDIGVFDAEGFLHITDRKKHLFKTSGGKYIAPSPIENLFLASKYIEQFIVIGDRRMFVTALIVPDYEALKEYADANRIQYSSQEELVKMKQIYEMLEKELSQFQKKLANYEKVRKFTILENPLTIEGGELTPKLSVKRKVVEERYSDLIDGMYEQFQNKI